MATPNYAYAYGSTPSSGGWQAIINAITSMLLGVNTTIAGAVTGGASRTVTPGSMTNITAGVPLWINWGQTDQECVSVTSVSGSTFTAYFVNSHTGGMTVTCGAPTLGLSSTWSKLNWTDSLTGPSIAFRSTADSPDSNANVAHLIIGSQGNNENYLAISSADDIDNTGTNAAPFNPAGYNFGNNSQCYTTIQDASFSYWITVCEYGIIVVVEIGGAFNAVLGGTLRRAAPVNNCGVGRVAATIASGATTVTVDRDLTSKLRAGQYVFMMNQSHNSASAHWNNTGNTGIERKTVASVTSTTVTFTSGCTYNYDAGALVGLIPQAYGYTGGTQPDAATYYMSRNNDGSATAYSGQTASADNGVITSTANSYNSPALGPVANVSYGEADVPIFQSTAGYYGYCGFLYGFQDFPSGHTNNLDTFFDNGSAWKAFLGSNAYAMGPLLNPQNTSTNPQGWIP